MTSHRREKISIVLPNYNHADKIGDAINAALQQTLPADEILIIDDASTDNSVSIIERFAAQEPRIRLLRNPVNKGTVYTINRGLQESVGDFLAFGASDDYYLPHFIQTMVAALERYPDAAIAFGDCKLLFEEKSEQIQHMAPEGTRGYLSPRDAAALARDCFFDIPGAASMFRRKPLVAIGGWHEALRWHTDWFVHYALAFRDGVVYCPGVMSVVRVIASGYSSSGRRDSRLQRAVLREMLDLLQSPEFCDVREVFASTGILSLFKGAIIGIMMTTPGGLRYLNRPFFAKMGAKATRRAGRWLRKILRGVN